ncbi:DUF1476 domain-containing protein [Rhizomicrobium electricum]|uniref:DUF1476 domain-containing protein n=1 Tax=Rhizomicrobium electricum TaxID=480070 RepID=A0ABN1FB32_9PROT|nr:DUF1476 domain-containing protein [Rhizomicrobium electricum]NIJ50708.1 hypothetical protein [Rhizomicrobium electricum]
MSESHNKHEHKWAFDEEVRFKATVRRNKLLGLWAAAELGLSGPEAEDYAKSVVASDMKEPGEEDVFRKVQGDFRARGVAVADEVLRKKMHEYSAQVRAELEANG